MRRVTIIYLLIMFFSSLFSKSFTPEKEKNPSYDKKLMKENICNSREMFMNQTMLFSKALNDFIVNDDETSYGSKQDYPYVTGNNKGRIVTVWLDYREKYAHAGSYTPHIYAQLFDTYQNPIGKNFRVCDESGYSLKRGKATAAINSIGNFVIVWADVRSGLKGSDIYYQLYDTNGNPKGPNIVINDDVGNNFQTYPSVVMDSTGNFIVTWQDDRNGNNDIYFQRFNSNGSRIGSNVMINDDSSDVAQILPSISIGPDGKFIISWTDYRNGNADIYAQIFDASGNPIGKNFRVNDDPGTEDQKTPMVFSDGFGNFIIVWEDFRNGDWDIYAQRFDTNGSRLGSNFRVNDDYGNESQFGPSVAMDSEGYSVICWTDNRNGQFEIYAQFFDANGAKINNNSKIYTNNNQKQSSACVSISDSGNFVFVWLDEEQYPDENIYLKKYNRQGQPLGTITRVNDDQGAVDQKYPCIAHDSNGNFTIAWTDQRNGNMEIYAQRFDSAGNPIGQNFRVGNDSSSLVFQFSKISMNSSGKTVIVGSGAGHHHAHIIDESGNFLVKNIKLHEDYNASSVAIADVAINNLGNFMAVWDDGHTIYAKIFDETGTATTNTILVNDDSGIVNFPKTAIAGNDILWVITWPDERGGKTNIFAQMYLSDGTPLGQNFQVNDSIGHCSHPNIAMQESGNFIIIWKYADGTQSGIFGQRFNLYGVPMGPNFKIDTNVPLDMLSGSNIDIDKDGNFVVVWSGYENNNYNIYAQKFDSDGNPIGENFLVNTRTERDQIDPDVALVNGKIITTWSTNHVTGRAWEICANILDFNEITDINPREEFTNFTFELRQNYPNPFNPTTTIEYSIPAKSKVSLLIYNALGQIVRHLQDAIQEAGIHKVSWDGKNDNGQAVPSGIYIYQIRVSGYNGQKYSQNRKMILIR